MDSDNERKLLVNDKSNSTENSSADTDDFPEPSFSESTSRNPVKTTGTFGAIFIVVNAAMGAGLLNIPAGFKLAGGIGPGIAVEFVRTAILFFL